MDVRSAANTGLSCAVSPSDSLKDVSIVVILPCVGVRIATSDATLEKKRIA